MELSNLIVVGPRDRAPEGYTVINTTSKAGWSSQLSPFLLGPCPLYNDLVAKNMENLWQFSKLYPQHADAEGNPTDAYWVWAKAGWEDSWAHRYPMGKGAVPLCSLWQGEKLGYIDARKRIYAPLYRDAVVRTEAYRVIKERVTAGEKIALWDYDGYNHRGKGVGLAQVLHNPKLKMGHAFVVTMMIELGEDVDFENDPRLASPEGMTPPAQPELF